MGGGASKHPPYVIRCTDEEDRSPVPTVSAKAVDARGPGARGSLVDRKSTNPETSYSVPGKSEKKFPPGADPMPSSISLPESPPLGVGRGQSSRRLISQTSIASMASTPGTAIKGPKIIQGGASFPWILKSVSPAISHYSQVEAERIIGTGFMGTVRLAKLAGKGGYFALKGVRKDQIVKHRDQGHIENERECMLHLNSPFCIRCFGTFQDGAYVYFAMELAAGGELFRRLSKKSFFPEDEAKFYLSEIFSALDHIHAMGYCYRDLKPENVMLDEDGHCKLVDFGFATKPDCNGICRTLCGTPAYLSPEQLNGKFTNGYSKACDWWSLGIILYELMTGKTPFCKNHKESNYEIYLRILKVTITFPRNFGKEARELVGALCHPSMDKRLVDPAIIRAHPFFVVPWDKVGRRMMVPPFVPRLKDEADRDHYFRRYPAAKEVEWTNGRLDLEGF